jgi:hypothetical protein
VIRVPTRKQYDALRIVARMATALLPSKQEFGPLRRHGWTGDNPKLADRSTRGFMPPQRITPAGLRALADAMERYEGEGGS